MDNLGAPQADGLGTPEGAEPHAGLGASPAIPSAVSCATCRHWKRDDHDIGWEFRFANYGACEAVRERWIVQDEATEGRKLGWSDGEDDWDFGGDKPPPPNSWSGVRLAALKEARAVVQDGSQYHAVLLTSHDFYCALFASAGEAGTDTTTGGAEGEHATDAAGDAQN